MRVTKLLAIAAFSAEIAFCMKFMADTKLAYAPGEGVLLLGIVPTLLVLASAYQLTAIFRRYEEREAEERTPFTVPAASTLGVFLGGSGVVLGSYTGPHGGPGLVAFALLAQLLAFVVAKRAWPQRPAPSGGA